MIVINARNVHAALPLGIHLLQTQGVERHTRNGLVLAAPCPVSTVYSHPREKSVMWGERDVNIAFLLYESLWMLKGRNAVDMLSKYVRNFGRYSDNKITLHGAYGYRWRKHFGFDQLDVIIQQLTADDRDRRNVLQMWDANADLGKESNDIPCNDMATFQIDADGKLNMVVFCRSNDIIWGAYFANAFHFGMLLEYMATKIGCEMGTYTQVSVNYHAYVETLEPLAILGEMSMFGEGEVDDPPSLSRMKTEYSNCLQGVSLPMDASLLDEHISDILLQADTGFSLPRGYTNDNPWAEAIHFVLKAHQVWRNCPAPQRFEEASEILSLADREVDWIILMKNWIQNRHNAYLEGVGRG